MERSIRRRNHRRRCLKKKKIIFKGNRIFCSKLNTFVPIESAKTGFLFIAGGIHLFF
jgi:hypothetical protein